MQQPSVETGKLRTKKPMNSRFAATLKHIRRDRQLLLLFIPCVLFYVIFRYGPLYGLVIAFKDYSVFQGVLGSEWVGLEHFQKFFSNQDFWMLFRNTFLLGFFTLIFGFPFPIILAVLLNEVRVKWFKKSIQTFSYLPAFLSVVIISSMIIDFLSPTNGLINQFISFLGFEKKYFLVDPNWFRPIYVISEIWATMGYQAIIYLAAIAGINPTLYEAAKVDGANRWHMMRNITIPGLMPTVIVMFILNTGNMFRIGYEKVLLLYNPLTYDVADVFSTYVYRKGLLESSYSYAAAVGMFESAVALVMLLGANQLSKRMGGSGLW